MNMKGEKGKNMRNRGITLIALVITIIVLLILAGVTIATLTGENGILTRANDAKIATEKAVAKEKVEMEVAGSFDQYRQFDMDALKQNLKNNLKLPDSAIVDNGDGSITVTVDGYEVKVDENGKVTVEGEVTETPGGGDETEGDNVTLSEIKGKYFGEDTTITIGSDKIKIPAGATVSNLDDECKSVKDGIVIYITNGTQITDWDTAKTTYDQFVWVSVKNAVLDLSKNSDAVLADAKIKEAVQAEVDAGRYPMAVKKSETDYIGVLYQFEDGTDSATVQLNSSWTPSETSYREPVILNDSSSAPDASNGVADLQGQYNTMVTSVATNGGFWVGRYETTNMNTNDVTVIKGITTGINDQTWYQMYSSQKAYKTANISTSTVTSSMIWGSQWDQIMIWMRGVKNTKNTTNGKFYVTNAVGMGNYGTGDSDTGTSGPVATGNRDEYKVKNVYDLAGNVYDWTLEASNTLTRVRRGGNYTNASASYTRADNRDGYYPTDRISNNGSRLTLY